MITVLTNQLKDTWNDNSAAIFVVTHDGRNEGIFAKKYHFENTDLLTVAVKTASAMTKSLKACVLTKTI